MSNLLNIIQSDHKEGGLNENILLLLKRKIKFSLRFIVLFRNVVWHEKVLKFCKDQDISELITLFT